MLRRIRVIVALLVGSLFCGILAQEKNDSIWSKISLDGFFRSRIWHLEGGASSFQSDAENYLVLNQNNKDVLTYQDLFFRARFKLKPSEPLTLNGIFDMGTLIFGQGNNDVGGLAVNNKINLATTNLFMEYNFASQSSFSIGVMPFSLPDGLILARNGAGIKLQHVILKKIQPFIHYIKAYENYTIDANNDNFLNENMNDRDILISGVNFNLSSQSLFNIYHIYSHNKSMRLNNILLPSFQNWLGVHSRYLIKKVTISGGAIFNWGILYHLQNSETLVTDIRALAWDLAIDYDAGQFKLGLGSRGASGNAIDQNHHHSFQDIAPSVSYGSIVTANNGGKSLRMDGRMFGISGFHLFYSTDFFDLVQFKLQYFQFISSQMVSIDLERSRIIGSEINMEAVLALQKNVEIYILLAGLKPAKGYQILSGHYNRSMIYEIMFGSTARY